MFVPWTLLQLAGAVALLLWGVHMVQTGVQRAFGARLRTFLGAALRDRFRAFVAGIGVTAVLQSSTATGLMVTGFAAGGLVDLVPALSVMLGANVGTTLIVQLLSFNVAEIAPVLILIGVMLFRRASAGPRDFGRVFIGLGLLLMALHQFVELLTPYEDAPSLRLILGSIATEPVLDVILAAALTWAAHSSVAIVLVVMSFASRGTVPLDAAFALVLGANLGTAINPLLEGNTKDQVAKRLPIGNLCNRVAGVVLALTLLGPIGRLLATLEPDPARAVADFHTGFNLLMAAITFPVLGPLAALLRRWLPARIDAADPATPLYLDSAAHETPVVALGGAAREALRLADILEAMLQGFAEALDRSDRRRVEETKRLDDVLDRLDAAIKTYLTELETEAMSEADHDRARAILTFAINMEAAGDVVDKGLLASVTKQLRRGIAFPPRHPRRARRRHRPPDRQRPRRRRPVHEPRRPRRPPSRRRKSHLPRPRGQSYRPPLHTAPLHPRHRRHQRPPFGAPPRHEAHQRPPPCRRPTRPPIPGRVGERSVTHQTSSRTACIISNPPHPATTPPWHELCSSETT